MTKTRGEIYQIWVSLDTPGDIDEVTTASRDRCESLRARGLLGFNPRLVAEFTAATAKKAMAIHDRYMETGELP